MLAGCPRMGGRRPPRAFRAHGILVGRADRAPRPTELAQTLTRAASTQTYMTIRYLVERQRRHTAYCAYAYFRWVDDVLDAQDATPSEEARVDRLRFLERQQALVERCLRGQSLPGVDAHEGMLVDLLQDRSGPRDALETYVRQMMRVMAFDAGRRGRLVSGAELEQYTAWLATAVTEAMHYFLGGHSVGAMADARYAAVTGAHILHMLRDTHEDLRAAYINVPVEILDAHGIDPTDVDADPYRAWVRERVDLARARLQEGRGYYQGMSSWRHRLAGLAYIARFEWLVERLEHDGFRVRPTYAGPAYISSGLRVGWQSVRPAWRRIAEPVAE